MGFACVSIAALGGQGGVMEPSVQDIGPCRTGGLFSPVRLNSFTLYTQNQIGKGSVIMIILMSDVGIEF